MIVAIGSLNPVKIKGVREAYTSIFGADISVRGIAVESGVSPQPLSLEETIRGAMNRAEEALKVVRDAVHGVGVRQGGSSYTGTCGSTYRWLRSYLERAN